MDDEARWERVEYDNRLDSLAEGLPGYVDAVLQSIDYRVARASPLLWSAVRRFFGGAVGAARGIAGGRTEPVSAYLGAVFAGDPPITFDRRAGRWLESAGAEGFAEFMDWVSDPTTFRASRLRPVLAQCPPE